MAIWYFVGIHHSLLNRVLKNIHFNRTRSAVDLAHKIHGDSNITTAPIIVLHGLLGSKKNWASISKKIADSTKKTVIAVDARNHGESPHNQTHTYPELASDVRQLMTTLSVNEATIIGHSMGGRTGMVLALTEPSKVKSLIVVDVSPITTPGILNDTFPKLLDVMKTVEFKENAVAPARIEAKKQLESVIEHAEVLNFVLMNVGRRHDKTIGWMANVNTLKDQFPSIATFPKEMAGKLYPGPTLFIAGGASNYVPRGDVTGIQGLFPKAQLKYIPNVGHNVHAEDPDAFFSMVTQFLAENN